LNEVGQAHAACQAAGATFLNLSASMIDGKYPGAKNINRMLQISFKIAKIMAPSMIYIEDVDQVLHLHILYLQFWSVL